MTCLREKQELAAAQSARDAERERLCARLVHLRRVDPDLTLPQLAARLEIGASRLRNLLKEISL